MKSVVLTPKGVCSKSIVVVLDDKEIIQAVTFVGGCKGALAAVGRLAKGLSVDQAVEILRGIPCRNETSCPDQMARLLKAYKTGGIEE